MANTSKWVLFLPPSHAYVRSFLYLHYTLIKLYYTKALSDQASSLGPDWILLLWRPRIPVSLGHSATTFWRDLPNPGIKPASPAYTGGFSTTESPGKLCTLAFTSVQSLSPVRLFATPWTAACQASLSIPTPGACLNSCQSSWPCHPNIASSVILICANF